MPLAKLSSKSQIVLPAEIRARFNLKPGDFLEISSEDTFVKIKKAPHSYVEALAGCVSEIWHDYEHEIDRARDQWDS